MKLIAFSGRARAGKTAMAEWLKTNYNYKVYTIAKYLKKLCMDLIGMNDPVKFDSYKVDGTSIKSFVDSLTWGKKISERTGIDLDIVETKLQSVSGSIDTVRDMLQIIGTDIIRCYNPDWHINECLKEINADKADLVVIDDCRFPNEKKAIEEAGGTVYFICRPEKLDEISNHKSETALKWRDFPESNILVNIENDNDGDYPNILEDYFKKVIFEDDIYILSEENYGKGVSMNSWFKTPEGARNERNYNQLLPYITVKQGKVLVTVSSEMSKALLWEYFKINKAIDSSKLIRINDPFIVEDLKEYINEKGEVHAKG